MIGCFNHKAHEAHKDMTPCFVPFVFFVVK